MTIHEFTPPEAAFTAEQMMATGVRAKLTAQELRPGLTVLSGSGANISVLNDADGKIMVDSGFAVSRPEIEAALARISDGPVRFLISTHFHFDHTDGNEWIHETGATLIAERHTWLRMRQPQSIPAFRSVRPPAPFKALPTIAFEQQMDMQLKDERIFLKRYAPAHTDSDIAVYFDRHDVLHTADTWFNEIYPFVDVDGGGSVDGLIAASKENLKLAGRETLVVPGHGKVGTRADLVAFDEMLEDVQGTVAQLKARGLSFEEVLATHPTARYDGRCGNGFIPRELFVWMMYRGA